MINETYTLYQLLQSVVLIFFAGMYPEIFMYGITIVGLKYIINLFI